MLTRRAVLLTALALGVALAAAGLVAARDGDDDPPDRPTGDPREWVQVVGGGDTPLDEVHQPIPATDVSMESSTFGFAAMATAGDGTLWLVDEIGDLYRVDPDGMISDTGVQDLSLRHSAGAAFGPDGILHLAKWDGEVSQVARIDPDRRFQEVDSVEILGLAAPVRGLHVGPNGQIYVADAGGAIYTVDLPAGSGPGSVEARPVDGTPPRARCEDRTRSRPTDRLVGIAVDARGDLLVADPHCEAVYRAGEAPVEAPEGPGCESHDLAPGHVLQDGDRTVVVGADCRIVWALEGDESEVLVEGDGPESVPGRAAAIDGRGNLYVTAPGGVFRARLPG